MRNIGECLAIAVSAMVFAGCPHGEVKERKGPSCSSIDPPGLPAGSEVGGVSSCMPAAACDNTDKNLIIANGLKVCTTMGTTACSKGDCPLPQDCKPEYLSARSAITIDCKAAADPSCTAPDQICKCTIKVATPGSLSCGCRCMNPAG